VFVTRDLLARLQSIKPSLEKKFGLTTLALFGSYSRDDATDESDIDVMVDFCKPLGIEFVDMADEIESLFNHKVDVVSRGGIKPKYFKAIEPDLIYV
jgi:uncharacterized protein